MGDGQKTTKKRSQAIDLTPYLLTGTPTRTRTWDLRFRKPRDDDSNALGNKEVKDNTIESMASCVAFLNENQPDLGAVVLAWDQLPEPIKIGILAMVRSTT